MLNSMKTLFLVLLAVLGVSGCYEPPAEFSIDPAFDAVQTAVIRDAAQAWCDAAEYCPAEATWTGPASLGAVSLDSDYARHGRPEGSAAFTSEGRIRVDADHTALQDPHVFWIALAHEFGHLAGIHGHTTCAGLMSSHPDPEGALEIDSCAIMAAR